MVLFGFYDGKINFKNCRRAVRVIRCGEPVNNLNLHWYNFTDVPHTLVWLARNPRKIGRRQIPWLANKRRYKCSLVTPRQFEFILSELM